MKVSLLLLLVYSASGEFSSASSAVVEKRIDLKDYLPGGSHDPSAVTYSAGITKATGPSLFEKVSRRYDLYENKLIGAKVKNRVLVDGITSATGLSVFDKVSRRFLIYKHRLHRTD